MSAQRSDLLEDRNIQLWMKIAMQRERAHDAARQPPLFMEKVIAMVFKDTFAHEAVPLLLP